MPEENGSTVERLKQEWGKRLPSLSINTIPDYALKQFLKISDERFGGDRGMALAFLVTQNEMANPEVLISLIQDLDERVRKLEGPNGNVPVGKIIRLANGKELNIGGK